MHDGHATADDTACRLCGNPTNLAFELQVLLKHDVSYWRCRSCGSLQTEKPYWLDEAYASRKEDSAGSNDNLNSLDVGAAQRNLFNMAATLGVAQAMALRTAVDVGGGDGLLCRLLRDYGLDAYVSDRYAQASYALGFDHAPFDRPDLITAFEVWEHFANPQADIAGMFAGDPKAVFVTTQVYAGEGDDWWYLIPETGHHVFFYSEKAFALIAERYRYRLLRSGGYTLFYKPGLMGMLGTAWLSLSLRTRFLRLLRARLSLKEPKGVARDFALMRSADHGRAIGTDRPASS